MHTYIAATKTWIERSSRYEKYFIAVIIAWIIWPFGVSDTLRPMVGHSLFIALAILAPLLAVYKKWIRAPFILLYGIAVHCLLHRVQYTTPAILDKVPDMVHMPLQSESITTESVKSIDNIVTDSRDKTNNFENTLEGEMVKNIKSHLLTRNS